MSDWTLGVNGVLACVFMTFLLATPVTYYVFVLAYRFAFDMPRFEKVWGTLFADIQPTNAALAYYPLFFVRRTLYAFTLICLVEFPKA
jgi:hypothetical protein